MSIAAKISEADGPPGYRGRSAPAQKGGVKLLDLYEVSLSLPPPNRSLTQKALFLSLSSTWGRRQGQGFLAWFPDGPSASPDPS